MDQKLRPCQSFFPQLDPGRVLLAQANLVEHIHIGLVIDPYAPLVMPDRELAEPHGRFFFSVATFWSVFPLEVEGAGQRTARRRSWFPPVCP